MTRECHVRFREGAGCNSPRYSTRRGLPAPPRSERFLRELRERFAKSTSRCILTRRASSSSARTRTGTGEGGSGQAGDVQLLGFTHICGKKRSGMFTVLRQTVRQRLQAKLQEVKAELRRRMHLPIPEQGTYLRSVVTGHVRYYGVPMNGPALGLFRQAVGRLWRRVLLRRSQPIVSRGTG